MYKNKTKLITSHCLPLRNTAIKSEVLCLWHKLLIVFVVTVIGPVCGNLPLRSQVTPEFGERTPSTSCVHLGQDPRRRQCMYTSITSLNLFPLIPACTARPGLPLLPASSARPGLPLSAPANGLNDDRHRQSPSHHSFESVTYT